MKTIKKVKEEMAQTIGHSCEKNPTLFCSKLNGLMPFIFFVFPTIVMKATCRLICFKLQSFYQWAPPLPLCFPICLRVTQKGFCEEIREGVRVGLHPLD